MSVKIKVFKMTPETSDEITNFMAGVKTIENGILISDGILGIMYKDMDEFGMEKVNLITAVSGELAKSQKQFVLQEGLARAYKALIANFEAKRKDEQEKADEAQKALDAFVQSYDSTLEAELSELNDALREITKKHQAAPKKEKGGHLEKFKEVQDKLNEVTPKFEAYKKEFDAKSSELSKILGTHAVASANILSDIKENQGFLETAIKDREHARVFIGTTMQLIKDIENGVVEGL